MSAHLQQTQPVLAAPPPHQPALNLSSICGRSFVALVSPPSLLAFLQVFVTPLTSSQVCAEGLFCLGYIASPSTGCNWLLCGADGALSWVFQLRGVDQHDMLRTTAETKQRM